MEILNCDTRSDHVGIENQESHLARLLAEQLPLEYAKFEAWRLQGKRGANGWYRSAFATIELALSQDPAIDIPDVNFLIGEASFLLRRPMGLIEGRNQSNEALSLQAVYVSSFLPVFKKRALGDTITCDDCRDLYRSLSIGMNIAARTTNGMSSIRAHLAEGIMFGLTARSRDSGNLIWPSSPREECTHTRSSNHDGYFIYNNQKLRAQSKLIATDADYEHPTVVVVFESLAGHVAKKVRQRYSEPITSYDIVDFVEIMAREAEGYEIDPEEKYQLDVATAHLLRPIAAFRQQDFTSVA